LPDERRRCGARRRKKGLGAFARSFYATLNLEVGREYVITRLLQTCGLGEEL
jgi:hypothetical protein